MKLSKQILEAVRRGIQLALDDYEDIETNNSIFYNNDIIVDAMVFQLGQYMIDKNKKR